MKHQPLIILSLSGLAWALTTTITLAAEEQTTTLDEITVTGTREGELLATTPATVDIIKGEEIRKQAPTHPSEIMGQVPGVWVNITGGEGHITAIRQPLTTNPVYLYLEDGIPTRSTGFFNHNALYEINLPMAGGIEVNKGPGTALYGSDAIGGVVNVLTHEPPLEHTTGLSLEAGQYGWRRAMLTHGNTIDNNGWRGDLNLTHTGGWRDATGYDRQSATARWDHARGDNVMLKTVASYSRIDQETAGSSTLLKNDYENNPTANYTPISFRKVNAFRLSSSYEREAAQSLLTLTPYLRYDDMDLLPNWSLSYDPVVYNTHNTSLGLMGKYRRDFEPLHARLIAGADLDYSPGSYYENAITTTTTTINGATYYTDYTLGAVTYDYDVTFKGISPYLHGELSPSEQLRLTAGVRYDHLGYDYDNKLSDVTTGFKRRPADTSVDFSHLSPKLGATYAISPSTALFANLNNAFRAPSESQLFRQGSSADTIHLKPVKVRSIETGLRSKHGKQISYELSIYHMEKRDDILTYQDPSTLVRETVNAGKTLHQGVEAGAGLLFADHWQADVALSYAKHTYEEWLIGGTAGVDYSGNEMETAPRRIANTRLAYAPPLLNGGRFALEWVSLGEYWMDPANTTKYPGHNLFNLRANYLIAEKWELFGAVTNLTDRRFAERASYTTARGEEYAPGMPRTLYAGVRYNWQ